jgi:hypothetical protein
VNGYEVVCRSTTASVFGGKEINMPGKVFVSCGQATIEEKRTARRVARILEKEFKLKPYLAFTIQSLSDIMTITKELGSSDYYLFIDFLRMPTGRPKSKNHLPISVFTHQELALAHHLGFEDMIALQQEGTPRVGFLNYVLSNPKLFRDSKDLIKQVRYLVKERGWSPKFSRNLVVREGEFSPLILYADHTGTSTERIWYLKVENRRPDVATVGSVCILDHIEKPDGTRINHLDRSYLKWAGQSGYERTILPQDSGVIDLFAIRTDVPGVFLHSLRDTPREPAVSDDGEYNLFFKLFSQGFPLLEFVVRLKLCWKPPTATEKPFETTAHLDSSESPCDDVVETLLGRSSNTPTVGLSSGVNTSGSSLQTSN